MSNPTPTPTPKSRRRAWLRGALTLAAIAVSLAGILILADLARPSVSRQERYQIPFEEIDCPLPTGMEKADFLAEVAYIGEFPRLLNITDTELPDRLAAAFAKHRRVQKVGKIEVVPPRTVRVELTLK